MKKMFPMNQLNAILRTIGRYFVHAFLSKCLHTTASFPYKAPVLTWSCTIRGSRVARWKNVCVCIRNGEKSKFIYLSKKWLPYPREYNPILNTTPGDIFWAHFGHFRRKIGQKYGNFRRFFAEIDTVRGLKTQKINRTPGLHWRGYGNFHSWSWLT